MHQSYLYVTIDTLVNLFFLALVMQRTIFFQLSSIFLSSIRLIPNEEIEVREVIIECPLYFNLEEINTRLNTQDSTIQKVIHSSFYNTGCQQILAKMEKSFYTLDFSIENVESENFFSFSSSKHFYVLLYIFVHFYVLSYIFVHFYVL